METKKVVVVIMVFCSFLTLAAQSKGRFSSQNYIGIMEGESGTGLQLQTINGFQYETWFAGIGTGIDYYFQRSIPLFVSVSKFLASPTVPLYINVDAGINFPWARNDLYYLQEPGDYFSALYWGGGLGYKFSFRKSNKGILLNVGYNYKRLLHETETTYPCLFPPCPVAKEKYDYQLRRLSVKVGWMF